jgi:Domain of unknown function (DUF4105)
MSSQPPHFGRAILFGLIAALAVLGLLVASKPARHDRIWKADLARLPGISRAGDIFRIQNYRDWAWDAGGVTAADWPAAGPFDIAEVKRTWFIVEPHPGLALMAHTLVIVEFNSGELIGVSVEARKEADEAYSVIGGAFNQFELLYQWATPKDLLTQRAVTLKRELYMYELKLTAAETQAYVSALVARTQGLDRRPRFYNTLTSNCTNELAKTAALGWDPAFIFTGRAAEALFRMDRLVGAGSFPAVKARARIDADVRTLAPLATGDFNAALLENLNARQKKPLPD